MNRNKFQEFSSPFLYVVVLVLLIFHILEGLNFLHALLTPRQYSPFIAAKYSTELFVSGIVFLISFSVFLLSSWKEICDTLARPKG
jgi:hypothetical protein